MAEVEGCRGVVAEVGVLAWEGGGLVATTGRAEGWSKCGWRHT